MDRTIFAYMMSSRSRTLSTGVTNSLALRVAQHQRGFAPGFSAKYRTQRLVYVESFGDIRDAIARQKQIKPWRREKKIALIENANLTWKNLAERWTF